MTENARHSAEGPQTGIPIRLAGNDTYAGLVVPFITIRHADGRPVFGKLDEIKLHACLIGRLCQLCGQRLSGRIVVFVRPRDLAAGYTIEPGAHPECAAYAAVGACPMLAGQMDHYQRSINVARCGISDCWCATYKASDAARAGQPAEPWRQVWIAEEHYRVRYDEHTRVPVGVQLAGVPALRTRRIGGPAPEEAVIPAILKPALELAVAMNMLQVASWSAERRQRVGRQAGATIAHHGDALMFGGPGCAEAFNALAEGLAVLAHQPGGVTFLDLHWCAQPHPDCPRRRYPTGSDHDDREQQ